ncbi:hypothetical protein [Pseudoalteromonas luteoviolacea]|uniref:Uncharacterized protein n=1 Tax=Pseudoalteromonas luteoviolacea H33 TaxID=1365251 RepID=A0A162AD52_9GAMM|nr:hypothetical protein [Pseudoalteromonas luteoviolacea]KZN47843.1 hypothetical protein N476_22730 [Pseudoalteromonas luteoviolacea H33]KZN74631.1 hypothetical protein N477_21625 [Pseudoalteromonas luteoviolacea H33-S]MBQ4880055.1 hypothetical protein [Pseudoalteromonas luteoviolacea]MBQ4909072.1 hypothetical protein [Pseudoalteromonas luteoviolacea]
MLVQKLLQTALLSSATIALLVSPTSYASKDISKASVYSAAGSVIVGITVSNAIEAVPVAISNAVIQNTNALSIGATETAPQSTNHEPLAISNDIVVAGPPPSHTQ